MPSIVVGNVADPVTNEDLEALFSQVGKWQVQPSYQTNSRAVERLRLRMGSSGNAAKAISEFDGKDLKGRNLKVNETSSGNLWRWAGQSRQRGRGGKRWFQAQRAQPGLR
jgi:RNA recognition motif-containing protein